MYHIYTYKIILSFIINACDNLYVKSLTHSRIKEYYRQRFVQIISFLFLVIISLEWQCDVYEILKKYNSPFYIKYDFYINIRLTTVCINVYMFVCLYVCILPQCLRCNASCNAIDNFVRYIENNQCIRACSFFFSLSLSLPLSLDIKRLSPLARRWQLHAIPHRPSSSGMGLANGTSFKCINSFPLFVMNFTRAASFRLLLSLNQ